MAPISKLIGVGSGVGVGRTGVGDTVGDGSMVGVTTLELWQAVTKIVSVIADKIKKLGLIRVRF